MAPGPKTKQQTTTTFPTLPHARSMSEHTGLDTHTKPTNQAKSLSGRLFSEAERNLTPGWMAVSKR